MTDSGSNSRFQSGLRKSLQRWDEKIENIREKAENIEIGDGRLGSGQAWNGRPVSARHVIRELLPIRILILTADPHIEGRRSLRAGVQVREIKEVLRLSKYRDRFKVDIESAVRVDDLRAALRRYKPHIVHFSGHGEGEDGLVLEDNDGFSQTVSTEALAGLFEVVGTGIECVLLTACYSEHQANAIYQFVDCVIGTNADLGIDEAVSFSKGFYDALGDGDRFDKAFDAGCNAIELSGSPNANALERKYRERPGMEALAERLGLLDR